MRAQLIIILASIVIFGVVSWSLLILRKHGGRVELTRNVESNEKLREQRADYVLQQLAANPKLTIGAQTPEGVASGKAPRTLVVVSRRVLPLLTAGDSQSAEYLLRRLTTVDVEPVTYETSELPNLIAEIETIRTRTSSSPLVDDLSTILNSLQKANGSFTEIVFY